MLNRIIRKHRSWYQIGMSIVIPIFYNGGALLGDCRGHKLTNNTAKVGRHKHGLQTLDLLRMQLRVHKPEEEQETIHSGLDVIDL